DAHSQERGDQQAGEPAGVDVRHIVNATLGAPLDEVFHHLPAHPPTLLADLVQLLVLEAFRPVLEVEPDQVVKVGVVLGVAARGLYNLLPSGLQLFGLQLRHAAPPLYSERSLSRSIIRQPGGVSSGWLWLPWIGRDAGILR